MCYQKDDNLETKIIHSLSYYLKCVIFSKFLTRDFPSSLIQAHGAKHKSHWRT